MGRAVRCGAVEDLRAAERRADRRGAVRRDQVADDPAAERWRGANRPAVAVTRFARPAPRRRQAKAFPCIPAPTRQRKSSQVGHLGAELRLDNPATDPQSLWLDRNNLVTTHVS